MVSLICSKLNCCYRDEHKQLQLFISELDKRIGVEITIYNAECTQTRPGK